MSWKMKITRKDIIGYIYYIYILLELRYCIFFSTAENPFRVEDI